MAKKDEDQNVDRRGFLQCMAWVGTGAVWTMSSGVLKGMPQAGRAGCFAMPLKLAGALARLLVRHCAPQNVTVAPSLAALRATTNDPPPAAYANTSALLLTDAAR